jgi:hypothetical protein
MWSEAAAVMLSIFHAVPPPGTAMSVRWDANEKDATEAGAYAIAVAAANHNGFIVRRRAHQGSGADFLMVRRGEPDNDFVKLEVSGIARGGNVGSRLKLKVE